MSSNLFEFAQKVADHLPEWTFGKQPFTHQAILSSTLPNTPSIILTGNTYDWERSTRVEIWGRWPEAVRLGNNTHTFSADSAPAITVAIERGPEAVAKSIVSRLLPKYLPRFAEQVARRDAFLRREKTRLACLQQLIDATGGRSELDHRGEALRVSGDRCYGKVEVYVGTDELDVHLDLRRVPLDVALRMLKEIN